MLRQAIRLCLIPVIAGLVYWSGAVPGSKLSARSQVVSNPTVIGLGGSSGTVHSVSATGYIFGASVSPDGAYHRFLRKPTGETLDLGPLQNDGGVVSNNGFVAAPIVYDSNTGATHAGFWSEATGWIAIPGIPQPIDGQIEPDDRTFVYSPAVNSSGMVVGMMTSTRPRTGQSSGQVLFRWTRAEGTVALPSGRDNLYAEIYGFNEAGQITGSFSGASDGDHAFRWSRSEGFVDLGTFPGQGYRLRAFGISEAGQVLGFEYFPEANIDMPFSWTPQSGLVALFPATNQFNYGLAANTRGQIAGLKRRPGGGWEYDSFFMESTSAAVQTIPGGLYAGSPAFGLGKRAINGSGQVVGQQAGSPSEAYYWSAADGLVALGGEGRAVGITESGLIAGELNYQPVIWQAPVATKADSTPPTVTVTSPVEGRLYDGEPVMAQYSCGDDSEIVVCAASVPSGAELTASQPGPHTFTVTAIDRYDNVTQHSVTYLRPDHQAPAVTVNLADGAGLEIGQSFTLQFSCSDDSQITQCGPATVGAQSVQSGTTLPTGTLGTFVLTIPASDVFGNQTLISRTYTVSPRLGAAIASPVRGTPYQIGQVVTASYSCTAPLGLASCVGTVENGAPIDTSAAGDFQLDVTATDMLGNMVSASVRYTVLAPDAPPVAALPAPPSGGFIGPISIGTLGGSRSDIAAMSRNGIITGRSYTANDAGYHGFVWTQANGMKDLGDALPYAVSASGQVVGVQQLDPPFAPMANHFGLYYQRGFSWTPSAGLRQLASGLVPMPGGSLAGDVQGLSEAEAVSNTGWVAGAVVALRPEPFMVPGWFWYRAYYAPAVWSPTGEVTVVPGCTGGWGRAKAINTAGQAVGFCGDETGTARAFVWSPTTGTVFLSDFGYGAEPLAINASGTVIGRASTGNYSHAFRWTAAGGMEDLTPDLLGYSDAYQIADNGEIIGEGNAVGFSWTPLGGLQWMPDADSDARGVNASGQIVGSIADSQFVLWTAGSPASTSLGSAYFPMNVADNHLASAFSLDLNTAAVWVLPGFTADVTAPTITMTTPANGATFAQGAVVTAAFGCADAAGISSCVGTIPNGALIDTSVLGTFAFTVSATDSNGNYTTATSFYTVTPPSPSSVPGHMRGEGHVTVASDQNERQRFAFDVLERPTGQQHMRFSFWTVDRDDVPKRTNVFEAASITSVQFSDDSAFVSGTRPKSPSVDSVTFRGTGVFNDQPGYSFEVSATDRGEPGAGLDTFVLVVRDGNGTVVFTSGDGAAQPIAGGNIQSKRLPNRHFLPYLSGGPERVREIEAAGPDGTVHTYALPTAVDENGLALAVSCSPASGSTFPMGRTRGTCTATDAAGRTGRLTFVVFVSDNTSPTFASLPESIVVDSTSAQGAIVTFPIPTATDLVDPDVRVTCNPDTGRRFRVGTTLVTCRARDAAHNVAVATFTVVVRDANAPTITLNKPSAGGSYKKGSSVVVTFACNDDVSIASCVGSRPNGSALDTSVVGTFTFTVTATDTAGNSAVKTATYTIKPR